MNQRIKQFANQFTQHNFDAFLVTNDANITYLTQFPAADSWLVVFPRKAVYITDLRYTLEARQNLKGISVHQYKKSSVSAFFNIVESMQARRIGFDARHVTVSLLNSLKKERPRGIKLTAGNNFVEQLREIKEKKEILQIKKAVDLNLQAYKYLTRVIKPGLTEKDILSLVDRYIKSRNASFSFDPIIASGPNSCLPHAKISSRKIRNNEPVLVDMGVEVNGYKSDLTRMFFLGKIAPLIQEVTAHVAAAQKEAIKRIKPGASAAEIDKAARNYLKKHKLAKFFGHALGHGIGLDVHESPRISAVNSTVLKEGMIFTVEPAVYIPNKFGIRIEDMVVVTKDGCEVLSW